MELIWLKNTFSQRNVVLFSSFLLFCIFYILFPLHKVVLKDNFISTDNPQAYYNLTYVRDNNGTDISSYYRHATSARNSSYPFLSGDTLRAFSDFIFDETRQDTLSSVKYGDIIFVKGDMLSTFFPSAFNSIEKPFVLVTHNSDFSVPLTYETYLLNSKILMWYTLNPSIRNHQKLTPIPIGLASTRWPSGSLDKITYALQNDRRAWSNRTTLLYANFDISTNKLQRTKARSQVATFKNVQIITQRIEFETYLQHIGNAKFVLSPPGNGLDCHRTWETLLMDAVPIVLTSELDPLFVNTKSVIIDDWSKLTENFLLSLNFSSNDNHLSHVLYARYWRETLTKHRNST